MTHDILVENFTWLEQSWWHNYIYIYVINTFNRSDPQSQGKRIFLFHLHLRTLSTSATPDSIYIFPIIKAIKCGNLS